MKDSLEGLKAWNEKSQRIENEGLLECKICGEDVDVSGASTVPEAIGMLVTTHGREAHPDRFTSSIEDVPDWFRRENGHIV